MRWLPSSTNCSPLPVTLSRRRTLDPCERRASAVAARPRSMRMTRSGGGGASSIRVHDAPRRWRRTLDSSCMARPGGGGCGAPRFAGTTHPVMARHVQWRWRPLVVRRGGECDGVRQAHLGMSPAVLHIQQQPMVYSLVAAVGPHRRQVSAGCTQQPGGATPVLLFRRRCFVDKPVRTFTGDSLMSGSSSSALMTDVGGGGQRFYLLRWQDPVRRRMQSLLSSNSPKYY